MLTYADRLRYIDGEYAEDLAAIRAALADDSLVSFRNGEAAYLRLAAKVERRARYASTEEERAVLLELASWWRSDAEVCGEEVTALLFRGGDA